MKKVDLNKLFAGLTKKFRVNMYEISHYLKPKNSTPYDITIDAYGTDIKPKDISKIEKLLEKCITGKVMDSSVMIYGNRIHIYIEFKQVKLVF